MEAISKAKFIRVAPRKTRLVVGLIRGLQVEAARRQLMVSTKIAAKPVLKALDSAVANAVNNLKMDAKNLVISKAFVDEGPKIKRFTPRAQGRATPIRHRMSHITIVVSPKS
jgi:large subunit ribosomal protein L22